MTRLNTSYPRSFISEHTAEYTLVPNLKRILLEEFSIVTPLFPWSTREGGTIARYLHKSEMFRVVGLYPRRPKLFSASQVITIKLNKQILIGSQCGMQYGIPIIAGCPLARTFWELGQEPVCLWIRLDQPPDDDLELQIEYIQSPTSEGKMPIPIFPSKKSLLAYLTDRAKLMDFDTATSAFRNIRRSSGERGYFSYFGSMQGYKPVYFLLKGK